MKILIKISAVLVFIILILFLIAEGVYRYRESKMLQSEKFFFKQQFQTHKNTVFTKSYGNLLLVLDPYLVYKNKPNYSHGKMHINGHGFRGGEINLKKPKDTIRVIITGGSAAFNTGIDDDNNTFESILERKLNEIAKTSGKKAEVINAAVIAYTSYQEMIYVILTLCDYQPDLVINFTGWNDYMNSRIVPSHNSYQQMIHSEFEAFLDRLPWESLLSYSAFYRNLRLRQKVYFANLNDEQIRGIAGEFCINMIKENLVLKAKGIKHIVILQPELSFKKNLSRNEKETMTLGMYRDHETISKYYQLAMDCMKNQKTGANIVAYDFSGIFSDTKEEIFSMPHDTVHINETGTKIIADEIFKRIIDLHLFDLSPVSE